MKYSKSVARSRLLKARHVSLKNHQYPLFESDPSFTVGCGRSALLVVGYRQTGVSTTLYDIALSLVRETPRPVTKKRHLLLVRSAEHPDYVWQALYSSLIIGHIDLDKYEPRVSELSLKSWLKGYGFDMIVKGPYANPTLDKSDYEIIHEVCDADLGLIGFLSRGHLGIKCLGASMAKRDNAVAVSYPLRWQLIAGVVLQTIPPHPDDDQPRIMVQVDKYRADPPGSFIGKKFVITTLPR